MGIEFDMTIRFTDVVTWVFFSVGFVSVFVKLKAMVEAHHKLLFLDSGEVNVLTHRAMEKLFVAWQEHLENSHQSLKDRVCVLEKRVSALYERSATQDKTHTNRVAEVRECVILISSKLGNICDLRRDHD